MKLRLASDITRDSIVDGPGLRSVIWAQGCSHNCAGCHNPETHDFNGGFEADTKDVINKLASLKLQKGVTLSGGDPFFQPEAMTEIAMAARTLNMNVWAYTGFTLDQLLDPKSPHYKERLELLQHVDVLVDGRFEIDKRDTSLLFRGSSNQRLIDVQRSLQLLREHGNHHDLADWPVLYDPENFTPVKQQDREPFLPLHWAASHGDIQLLEFFLQHGANAADRDKNGQIVLDVVKEPSVHAYLLSVLQGKGEETMSNQQTTATPESQNGCAFISTVEQAIQKLKEFSKLPKTSQGKAVMDFVAEMDLDLCREMNRKENLEKINDTCGPCIRSKVQNAASIRITISNAFLDSDPAQETKTVSAQQTQNASRNERRNHSQSI